MVVTGVRRVVLVLRRPVDWLILRFDTPGQRSGVLGT